MKKKYTISIYTENVVGLLSRITAVLTRRHINIESLTVSETERTGISRFIIVINETDDMLIKVTKQLNKIVEVIHAEYFDDSQLITSQIGLFKVDLYNESRYFSLQALATQSNAQILSRLDKHVILEKTGNRAMLEAFLEALKAYGETEYVRSGRIALTMENHIRLNEIMDQLADINNYPGYKMMH